METTHEKDIHLWTDENKEDKNKEETLAISRYKSFLNRGLKAKNLQQLILN